MHRDETENIPLNNGINYEVCKFGENYHFVMCSLPNLFMLHSICHKYVTVEAYLMFRSVS